MCIYNIIIGPCFRLHRFPIKDESKQKTRIQTDTERWGIYRQPFLNTYNKIVPSNRRRITSGSIYWVFHVHKTIREKDTTGGRTLPPMTISFLLTSDFLRLIGRLIYNWTSVVLFDFWQLAFISPKSSTSFFSHTRVLIKLKTICSILRFDCKHSPADS